LKKIRLCIFCILPCSFSCFGMSLNDKSEKISNFVSDIEYLNLFVFSRLEVLKKHNKDLMSEPLKDKFCVFISNELLELDEIKGLLPFEKKTGDMLKVFGNKMDTALKQKEPWKPIKEEFKNKKMFELIRFLFETLNI